MGYEPVASLAVKRGAQLKKETNEECGFVFLYNKDFSSGVIVREAEGNGKIMARLWQVMLIWLLKMING